MPFRRIPVSDAVSPASQDRSADRKPRSTDLVSVVGPGREEHRTVLFVEREVLDVDGARAAKYDHRQPRHVAVRRHYHVSADRRPVRRHLGATHQHK